MEGTVEMAEPRNVTRFAILPPMAAAVKVGSGRRHADRSRSAPRRAGDRTSRNPSSASVAAGGGCPWRESTALATLHDGKRPGVAGADRRCLHGPVPLRPRHRRRPGARPCRHGRKASLKRFAYEWSRFFRGELPVKDDTAVTAEDIRRSNLILFGDPGSNSWIARVLPGLPVRWTRTECAIGEHARLLRRPRVMLIQPNPLAHDHDSVLNSGHTFHEKELATLNYLLFPRLGDWAVVKVPDDPTRLAAEAVVRSGFFDEQWAVPVHSGVRVELD